MKNVSSFDLGHDDGFHHGLGGWPSRAPEEQRAQTTSDEAVLRTGPAFDRTATAMMRTEFTFDQPAQDAVIR